MGLGDAVTAAGTTTRWTGNHPPVIPRPGNGLSESEAEIPAVNIGDLP
jgi:hypothetical protein